MTYICVTRPQWVNVGIDRGFASGAVVSRATTHEWGRPLLRAQRGAGRPHETTFSLCNFAFLQQSYLLMFSNIVLLRTHQITYFNDIIGTSSDSSHLTIDNKKLSCFGTKCETMWRFDLSTADLVQVTKICTWQVETSHHFPTNTRCNNNVSITSNDFATSFWRDSDVIITPRCPLGSYKKVRSFIFIYMDSCHHEQRIPQITLSNKYFIHNICVY